MAEQLKILDKYPIRTRLSLNGTLIVARDIAHAKLQERIDSGEGLPQYFKDHPVYYAGPAKTPKVSLTIKAIWVNSADNKFLIYFLFNKTGSDNLNEMSKPIFLFGKIRKNIAKCFLLNVLPVILIAKFKDNGLTFKIDNSDEKSLPPF